MTKDEQGTIPPAPYGDETTPFQEALWRLVFRCEQAAETVAEPKLSAQLSYATGRICEELLEDQERAKARYLEAFGRDPSFGPNLQASRRLEAATGNWAAVLDLIDAELRPGVMSQEVQAELYLERGTILDRQMGERAKAGEAYACAMELDEQNPQVWIRLLSSLSREKSWIQLDDVLARVQAQATTAELRAALLERRAALHAERFDEPDRAIELYEKALEERTDSPAAFNGLERLYREQKRWSELAELHEKELRLLDGPAKIFCYYRLARLYTRRFGRADLATELLEKAVRIEAEDVLVLTELAKLYEQAARYEDQVSIEERLLSLSHDQTEQLALHHRIGMLCEERLDDDERAIEHYRAAVELRPSYTPAMSALGRLYRKNERLEELLEMHKLEAKQAVEEERQALSHYRAAEMLENELERVDDAVEQYEEAVRWVPSFLPAQHALAQLYTKLERWEDLVRHYENEAESLRGGSMVSDRQEPLRVARLEQIARLWEDKIGNLEEAAKANVRILEIDPGHVGSLYALERIYEKDGQWSKLMELHEREVELVEDEAWAAALLHRIGEIAEEHLEDRNLAVVYYRRALTIRPSYVPTLTALGRIFTAQERFSDLLSMERKELEVTDDRLRRASIAFRMGEIYEHRLNDLPEAEASYRQALELDPELWPALNALERLFGRRRGWADLAEVLEEQAGQLESSVARAVAFYRVGELWEERLGRRENAWEVYHQALSADPANYPARIAVARLAREQSRWSQLAETLSDLLSTVGDGFAALEALAELAGLWRFELDAPEQALEVYGETTAMAPNDLSALLGLTELYWTTGQLEEFAEICRRLVETSEDPPVKIGALRELAGLIEMGLGEGAEAKEIWAEVLALKSDDFAARRGLGVDVGMSEPEVLSPEISAGVEMLRVLSRVDDKALKKGLDAFTGVFAVTRDWAGLARAYDTVLVELGDDEEVQPALLAVRSARARLGAEYLGESSGVEDQLRGVLEKNEADVETRAALADLLSRDEQRRDEAIVEHLRVLRDAPCRLTSIRALELLWREGDEPGLARLALGVLSGFKATNADEEEEYNRGRRALSEEAGESIDRGTLKNHIFAGSSALLAPEVLGVLDALEPHLPKVYSPDLGAFGLTRKDRIPPTERHSLRRRGELLGWLMGVSSFDIYLHQVPGRGEGIELTDPPSLILPQTASDWSAPRQLLVLGRLLGELALGTWVARKLSPFELQRLVTAATRIFVESHGREMASPDAIDNLCRKLERTIPESGLAALEQPAKRLAARQGDVVDYDECVAGMTAASRRVGLWVCDDMEQALELLAGEDERIAEAPKTTTREIVAAYRHSEALRDLIPWSLSEDHLVLRKLAGMEEDS